MQANAKKPQLPRTRINSAAQLSGAQLNTIASTMEEIAAQHNISVQWLELRDVYVQNTVFVAAEEQK